MDELSLKDYWAILRRRKMVYWATVLAIAVLGIVAALLWSRYTSTATVQIQSPSVPQQALLSIGGSGGNYFQDIADQRIQKIQQKLMSPDNLGEIIRKLDLYPWLQKSGSIDDAIAAMRSKVKVSLESTELSNPASAQGLSPQQLAAIAFTVSFTYDNPVKAKEATSALVEGFLRDDALVQKARAEDTAHFLGQQVAALDQSISEQNAKIAQFVERHPNSRPEALAFNQQMLASTSMNIEDVQRQMTAIEKSRGDLRAQLANVDPYTRVLADGQVLTTPAVQLKALEAKYAEMSGVYGPKYPDLIKLQQQITALRESTGPVSDHAALQSQITDVKANLAAAEKTYGPKHPDVIGLKRQLAHLQDLAAQSSNPNPSHHRDADNPAYLMLQSQIHAADAQLQALQAQHQAMLSQRAQYEALIAEAPVVGQQYMTLTRDLQNMQQQYDQLKEKQLAANMQQRLVTGRLSERLILQSPPRVPLGTTPPRKLIAALGVVFGFFGGLVAVYIAEAFSGTVNGSRQLTQLVGVPPLVVVPHLDLGSPAPRQSGRLLAGVAVLTLIAVAVAVYVAIAGVHSMPFGALRANASSVKANA